MIFITCPSLYYERVEAIPYLARYCCIQKSNGRYSRSSMNGSGTKNWVSTPTRSTAIASNPGHCLWSGIVPKDRAARVVARLMQPDMWSGWGIRTLSASHKSFNPYNYQTGAVWPHDNAIIALGFRRYGFAAEAAAVARSISGAASHF